MKKYLENNLKSRSACLSSPFFSCLILPRKDKRDEVCICNEIGVPKSVNFVTSYLIGNLIR